MNWLRRQRPNHDHTQTTTRHERPITMNDQINPVPSFDGPPPPASVRLPEGMLACRSCGIATDSGGWIEKVSRPMPQSLNPAARSGPTAFEEVDFTRCAECCERLGMAEALAERLPELSRGAGNQIVLHVVLALDVFAALGAKLPALEAMDYPDAAQMLRALSFAGNSVQFALMGAAGTATGGPWRHVTSEHRQRLRATFTGYLARRVARQSPPVPVACPEGRGCLLCGVAAVTLAAVVVHDLGGIEQATAETWRRTGVNGAGLGGSVSGYIKGHLCPECARAVEDAGAMGHGAMIRSLIAHLKSIGADTSAFSVRDLDELEVEGLTAWAVTGRAPSNQRWEHVSR